MDAQKSKHQKIAGLMREFDNVVQVGFGATVPPEMAERLRCVITEVPSLSKRVVVLTGMDAVLEECAKAPDLAKTILKLGSFEARANVSLTLRMPIEMDERLTKLVKSIPNLSRRDVAAAGLDWILTRCEAVNGGTFLSKPDSAQT